MCQNSYAISVYHEKTIATLFMLKYFIIILANYLAFMSSTISFQTRQCKQYYFWYTVVSDLSVIPWLGTLFCVGYCRNISQLIVGAWLFIWNWVKWGWREGIKIQFISLTRRRVDKVHSKEKQQIKSGEYCTWIMLSNSALNFADWKSLTCSYCMNIKI